MCENKRQFYKQEGLMSIYMWIIQILGNSICTKFKT
jgi:hypothetical protein